MSSTHNEDTGKLPLKRAIYSFPTVWVRFFHPKKFSCNFLCLIAKLHSDPCQSSVITVYSWPLPQGPFRQHSVPARGCVGSMGHVKNHRTGTSGWGGGGMV